MEFNEAIQIVCTALAATGTIVCAEDYDGIAVKKLLASNTLDEGRTTNQTHLAITGSQMDIFPYLRSEGYLTGNEDVPDEYLKKYFVGKIPVDLYSSNIEYLSGGEETGILFQDGKRRTNTSIIRSKRNEQADQIQVSLLNFDGPDFVTFRRLLHIGTYMIILKKKGALLYDFFGVIPNRSIEGDGDLQRINNQLFIRPTNTGVDIAELTQNDNLGDMQPNVNPIVAENILLYGVPGCGKSHTIKTEYCDNDDYMERAVFHPDYTYSDFVGQILPKVKDGHIEYRFKPGPFTRILKKARKNRNESFYLVVEEINRGNAPAIFGDIFQLLDRGADGCSEYGVSNENVASYVYGDVTTKIKIPGNLFVLATMNTSDQNVFTLDTAFKRRWAMRMIENNIDACEYANHQICAWGITWGIFAKTINQKIIELGENNLSNEDNRLGAYFIREADLNDAERFGEKVLMYLWNDAFKFDHDKVFKTEYRTLDELIAGFIRVGFAVFNDNITFENIADGTDEIVETDNPTVEQYLEGKNPELVTTYHTLFDAVVARIPNAYDSSVGSLTYAAWKANDIRKASFADIIIQRNKIVISCEIPTSEELRVVGEQIPVDNHHNHYFKIVFDAEQAEQIVDAIVDSYNQLKVQ